MRIRVWLLGVVVVLTAGVVVAAEDAEKAARRMEEMGTLLGIEGQVVKLEQQTLERRVGMWKDPVLSVARLVGELRQVAREMDKPELAVDALRDLAHRTSSPMLQRYIKQHVVELLRELDRPEEAMELLQQVARETLLEVARATKSAKATEERTGRARAEFLKERERHLTKREQVLKQSQEDLEIRVRQLEAQSAELKRYAEQLRQLEERMTALNEQQKRVQPRAEGAEAQAEER